MTVAALTVLSPSTGHEQGVTGALYADLRGAAIIAGAGNNGERVLLGNVTRLDGLRAQ